ncbi:HPF/RaiA family ribosome-associated protein [Rhodoligotrophos defluvii]|uniref:HPF/RaiA family ribosome-associated protein n=1 Tax=Rhodoligotrophos defluvii TaxID=2561934 RepID=UPI0010C93B46|nr:HPF/RaiA family ribosome-associated protein [Rhodoligotrophos defluvii]
METPIQIAFKNLDTSEFLERHIRERASKLERFHHNITACRVVVDAPHRSSGSGKPPLGITVEVEVPGRTLVAKNGKDTYDGKDGGTALVNRVFEAMERQLGEHADIRSQQVKTHEAAADTGTVVRLFPEQNYGFIEVVGSPDLYFTRNAVVGGSFDDLKVGTMVQVTRATTEGPWGPQASSVRRLSGETSA